jgi:hypothetical protein
MNPYQGQNVQQLDQIKNQCRNYMNYHVIGQLSDGSQVDGIIDSMDDEGVTLLVPEDIDAEQTTRQFGYGYDDYGNDYDDYDRPRRRRYRRFRRRRYPYPYLYNVILYPYFYPPYPYPYGGYGGY